MYAIVDIAGQQFKVEKDQKLFVHRLEGEAGSKVSFEKVLLIENGGKVTVGTPVIKDAAVSAKLIEHVKGDKVLVFKKKRRKGYKKLNGHRQFMTQIEITDIQEKAAKKAAPKATAAKAEKPAAEKKEAAPKAAAKKASTPKTAAKKETAPKAAAKKETTAKATPKAAASKTTAKKEAAPKAAPKKAAATKAAPTKQAEAKKPAAKSADKDAAADKK